MSDVSYSRLDRDFVGQLREALAAKEQDAWIDQDFLKSWMKRHAPQQLFTALVIMLIGWMRQNAHQQVHYPPKVGKFS